MRRDQVLKEEFQEEQREETMQITPIPRPCQDKIINRRTRTNSNSIGLHMLNIVEIKANSIRLKWCLVCSKMTQKQEMITFQQKSRQIWPTKTRCCQLITRLMGTLKGRSV